MSLPRQSNVPSSSPSKPSLRRSSSSRNRSSNSLGPTTHFASEATQHHFLPHSPPNQNLEYESSDEEAIVDSAGSYGAPHGLAPFQPFFTLIEDTVNNEHYHPTVHYIFADDDTDIVTEAACRSLEQNKDELESGSPGATTAQAPEDEQETDMESRLPRQIPGVKEHYLILDVQPTRKTARSPEPGSSSPHPDSRPGWTYAVSSAQSFSADWQILRTAISDAPTMGDQDASDEGLMLRIEGRGNTPPDQQLKEHKSEKESMEEMIERFQKRLSEIKQLVDVGDSGAQTASHEGPTSTTTAAAAVVVGGSGGGDVLDEPD